MQVTIAFSSQVQEAEEILLLHLIRCRNFLEIQVLGAQLATQHGVAIFLKFLSARCTTCDPVSCRNFLDIQVLGAQLAITFSGSAGSNIYFFSTFRSISARNFTTKIDYKIAFLIDIFYKFTKQCVKLSYTLSLCTCNFTFLFTIYKYYYYLENIFDQIVPHPFAVSNDRKKIFFFRK